MEKTMTIGVSKWRLFISQELWELVEGAYDEPDDSATLASWKAAKQKEFKENKKKDAKLLLFIQQGVSKTIYLSPYYGSHQIKKCLGCSLKTEFQGSTKVISIKLQSLWREFDNLSMKDGESIYETIFW